MKEAISERRSIRKFTEQQIPEPELREVIECGIKAPSAKNRQPWKFFVVRGEKKAEMLSAFIKGIEREETGEALLPGSREHTGGARYTVRILAQAPVAILVVNPFGRGVFENLTAEERCYEVCNIQSASAAIQNMLLAATEKGIGSLWVCDTYFAYRELREWLGTEGDLIAAVALGYPDETPHARPRKSIEDVVVWME